MFSRIALSPTVKCPSSKTISHTDLLLCFNFRVDQDISQMCPKTRLIHDLIEKIQSETKMGKTHDGCCLFFGARVDWLLLPKCRKRVLLVVASQVSWCGCCFAKVTVDWLLLLCYRG